MIIYQYNKLTGEFLHKREANLDPLETEKQRKNIYLMPASTTIKKPPLVGENQVGIFIDDKWIKKADYRKEIYYKIGTKEKVKFGIGDKPDSSMTQLEPFDGCKWDGGKWIIDEEILMGKIRGVRNGLLDNCDITNCNAELWEDMIPTKKDGWRTYKQALRDLPENVDVHNPVYPEKPE